MTTLSPFQDLLVRTGLRDNEAKLYLELLQNGSKPAGRIATALGLKRGYTYNLIDVLVDRGLLTEFEIRGVRYFTAVSPSIITNNLNAKMQQLSKLCTDLTQALPFLENLSNNKLSVPRVQLFRGVDGIKAIYEDTLSTPSKTIYAFADFDHTFPRRRSVELNNWMWEYASRRAARDIWYHGIVNRSRESDAAFRRRKEQKRRLKMLKNVALEVEINIYGDSVAITSTANEMSGIIVKDASICASLCAIHQCLWETSPGYKLSV